MIIDLLEALVRILIIGICSPFIILCLSIVVGWARGLDRSNGDFWEDLKISMIVAGAVWLAIFFGYIIYGVIFTW